MKLLKSGADVIVDIEPATKIAVIRCNIVSDTCPGVGCLKAFNRRTVHFSNYSQNVEMIAVFTCGGCSGRRVHRLVKSLLKHGVDVIHLSSCMQMDNYPVCPHIEEIKRTITNANIKLVAGTHH